jgi:hypothetical protein
MTPFRVLVLGLLVIAGVLYVLNPGPEKFREFLQEELAAQAEERARRVGEGVGGDAGGDVAGFIAGRLGRQAGDLASDAFQREDYHLASIYTADLNGRRPGGAWKFLGIAGWFVPLEQP